jgi:hypothetical protein
MEDRTTQQRLGCQEFTPEGVVAKIALLEEALKGAQGVWKIKLQRLEDFKSANGGCDAKALEAVYELTKSELVKYESTGIAMPNLWNEVHRLFALMMEAHDIELQVFTARISAGCASEELESFIIAALDPEQYSTDSRTFRYWTK